MKLGVRIGLYKKLNFRRDGSAVRAYRGWCDFEAVVNRPCYAQPLRAFLENYLRGIWLELISISYIGVMAWAYGQSVNGTERLSEKVVSLVAVPAVLFVLCLGAALGLPKLGIVSVLATVAIPAIFGATSLLFTSLAIRSFTK